MAAPRSDLVKTGKEVSDILDEHLGRKERAAARAALAKIGREGFEILDKHLGRKGKFCQPGGAFREVLIADIRPKNAPRKA